MKVIAKPIEVIAWYKKDGSIRPLRFKYETKDEKVHIIKIEQIYSMELEKIAGNLMYKFTCKSTINSIERIYELKYDIDKCKWILFKI